MQRAALIALLLGIGPIVAGCADFDMDKLDVLGLNQKKKLPGERRAVFPEGVPGVTQGIPPEYLKGNESTQPGAAVSLEGVKPQAAADTSAKPEEKKAAEPAAVKPKPKKRVAKRPPRIKMAPEGEQQPAAAAQPAAQPAAAQAPANASQGWPPPSQSQASPWPAPPPAGTFSKQQ
jgi:hypothetical protein